MHFLDQSTGMDVRFYPAAAGSSLPGDPSNLDFAQCLGYYNYNKVIIPASGNSCRRGRGRFPESRSRGSVGAGRRGARGCPKAPGPPAGPCGAVGRPAAESWRRRVSAGPPPSSSSGGGARPGDGRSPGRGGRCLGPALGRSGPVRRPHGAAGTVGVRVPLPRGQGTKGGSAERAAAGGSGRDLPNFSPGWSRSGGRAAPRWGSGTPAREGGREGREGKGRDASLRAALPGDPGSIAAGL